MPRVVFRCDASAQIGGGHLARCMALARALRARGAEIELATRGLPHRLKDLLVSGTGAVVHDLPDASAPERALRDAGEPLPHANWLGVSQRIDAEHTLALLRERPPADWLVVDHYALDARWEHAVKAHAHQILAIDDLADRDHACDALLDQNFFLDADSRYTTRVPRTAELMLGPKFALLREEFAKERAAIALRDGALHRIFICFGGFDRIAQTLRALDAIEAAALGHVAIDVILGNDDPQRAEVERRCALKENWRTHVDASNVAALMAHADLGIGASGIMNWERAALGLPAVIASVAENQHVVARDLAADRACIYLGSAEDWRQETLAGLLRGLHGTPSLLLALGARAARLGDGRGAQRVAARMLPATIELRRAKTADCEPMHGWRNAEETRRHAFDGHPIAPDAHRRWFQRVLEDPAIALLVGEHEDKAVGVVRYDVTGKRALVSIYLVPGAHGRGFGAGLLEAGSRWMRTQYPAVTTLEARIRRGNERSLDAFANAGYTLESHTYTRELCE